MSTERNDKKTKFEASIERYRKELEKDSHIDITQLENEMVRVTSLQSKWINYYAIYDASRVETNRNLKIAKGNALMRMIKGSDGFAMTKSEANKLQNYDQVVIELEEKLEKIELCLRIFSEAQQVIRSKSFALGNILKLREFEAGLL